MGSKTETREDDGLLRDCWYFAGLSRDIRAGGLVHRSIAGEPLVLGRDETGAPFALRDICPHRAAPLSAGRMLDHDGAATVECPYHGWRFRARDGVCAHIPSLVEGQDFEATRIRARRYPAVEQGGLVWAFIPSDPRFAGEPDHAPPRFAAQDKTGAKPKLVLKRIFDCHVDHAVVGLMDPAHGPFVHRQWWWRSAHSLHDKAKAFEPREFGFAMAEHKPSSNSYAYRLLGGAPTTEIVFRLPGVRTETIRNARHTVLGFTAVTPLDARTTEITQVFFWDAPILSLIWPFAWLGGKAFLDQDGSMVDLQQQGLKHDPNLMLIPDADMQAIWYQRLKKEWAASRAEGRAFANPVQPVTLRWRS